MPHQCVRCGKLYPVGSKELLEGCECKGRFFFFVKEGAVEKAQEVTKNLSLDEKKQIEKDVLDIVGDKLEDDKPIILDFESIRVRGPGKYELDLVDMFRGKPLVYKLDDGKYVIDIVSTFERKGEE